VPNPCAIPGYSFESVPTKSKTALALSVHSPIIEKFKMFINLCLFSV